MAIASSLSKARAPILSSVSGYLKIVKNGKNRCPLLSSAIINPSPKGKKVKCRWRGEETTVLQPLPSVPAVSPNSSTKNEVTDHSTSTLKGIPRILCQRFIFAFQVDLFPTLWVLRTLRLRRFIVAS